MNQNDTNMNVGHANAPNGQVPASGLSLDDIYYTVFRHKWILVGFTCLGIMAAGIVFWIKPPRYESVAKVMVRYVLDNKEHASDPESIRPLESGGANVIKSEVEILTSLDVAALVADIVGPERILAKAGGGSNRLAAAGMIRSGIEVKPPQTTVITVTFRHPDAEVVQPVLRALLETYTQKHREVRLGYGVLDEYYIRQRDDFRDKVARTEEQLKKLKTQAKVLSVDDAKRAFQGQIEKLTSELHAAETELAVAKAVVGDVAQVAVGTNESPNVFIPAESVNEYSEILEQLESLKKRDRELMLQSQYTAEHPSVRAIRNVIDRYKAHKSALEEKYPSLRSLDSLVGSKGTNSLGIDIAAEIASIKRLNAKVEKLGALLNSIQAEAMSVMDLEPEIAQLERQREQEEKEYQFYQATIEQARQGETADAGKVVNMSIVQHPTPPGLEQKKLLKLVGGAFAACVGCGVALALLIDFILDRTIRRSVDVRRHLRLPLFLTILDTSWAGRFGLPRWLRKRIKKTADTKLADSTTAHENGMAPWDSEHHLRLFADGLRERLITYFEINNVNHTPKLVGMTGCNHGSGVTTLASGLAAALSKTGDGNVLLVDMNVGQGEAHSFHGGKPGCALADVLEPDSRADARVQDNLYLASLRPGDNDKLAKVMPSHFMHLVPKLKASDYDYIIFDLPPVAPISVTPRLASYMDMVLLVLESEKTPQQLASQAGTLLAEARANAAVVLNKCRKHVPPLLSHDM